MKSIISFSLLMLLGGCAAQSPREAETRVVTVPSPAPYNYLKWSKQCPMPVNQGIRKHNRTHKRVIDTLKAAQAKQSTN